MNILLIGFRYYEIEEIQDRLEDEFLQLKIDFAISIRDSWYRLKISSYDLIILDATSSETDALITHQEIFVRSEGIPVILLAASEEVEKLSRLNDKQPKLMLVKDNDYMNKLIKLLKDREENSDELELSQYLQLKENIHATPIKNEINQIDQVIITFDKENFTTQTETNSLFDRSLLEQMLSGLSDGLLFCNSDNKILLLNQTAESMLGLPKAKLIGKSILELPLGDGADWLVEILKGVKTNIRFNSLAFKTRFNDQIIQIRFAPIYGRENYYMGGFLYLTEADETAKNEQDDSLFILNDKIFNVLHLTTPKIIAEG